MDYSLVRRIIGIVIASISLVLLIALVYFRLARVDVKSLAVAALPAVAAISAVAPAAVPVVPDGYTLYAEWQATLDRWLPGECFVNENMRVRNGMFEGVYVAMVKFPVPTDFPYTGVLRLRTSIWDENINPLWLEVFPLATPVAFCPREETFGSRRDAVTLAAHASPFPPAAKAGKWTYIPLEGITNYLQLYNHGMMIVGWSDNVSTGRTFDAVELLLFRSPYAARVYVHAARR